MEKPRQKLDNIVLDEEQTALINDIVSLLVAAGYFRARIRGLSPFDKIVGGLVWCLEVSSIDVDVDLFYDADSLTIGQKIAVTEKIVRVLERIKCPQKIQPHQIQGLDAAAIFPVVQWLVKKAVETRKERKEATLARGQYEFDKSLRPLIQILPDVASKKAEDLQFTVSRLESLKEKYAPKRIFRRKTPLDSNADEETTVKSTLLEFGMRVGGVGGQGGGESVAVDGADSVGDAGYDEVSIVDQDATFQRDGGAEKNLLKLNLDSTQLSTMQKAVESYQASAEAAQTVMTPARLRAKIDEAEKAITEAVERRAELKAEMAKLRDDYKAVEARNAELDAELEKMGEVVNAPENQAVLVKLEQLLKERDEIKEKEDQLRKTAREESARLEAEIAAYKTPKPGSGDTEAAEEEEALKEEVAAAKKRVDAGRLELAAVNKRLAELSRRYDAVPLRAELVQYQRRFVELYDEVASKHRETKQYYTLYNTLEDQKAYLDRAAGLMNSVVETFPRACAGSDAAKEEFVAQLDGILAGIRTSQSRLDERKAGLETKRDALREERRRLADAHRTYLKTVKLFQEECKKNEKLIAALTQRETAA